VTGEDVPDATDQVTIWKYINPRQAVWPEADYIVSNPPFIGNKPMRERLGDGYTEVLRQSYQDVPDTVDFVMYWWHKAAQLVRNNNIKRFGFITTNTITQIRQRKVIEFHESQKQSLRLFFAVPDHPWTDGGAAVRIAMTSAENASETSGLPRLAIVVDESEDLIPEDAAEKVVVTVNSVGQIFSDLRSGPNLLMAKPLQALKKISSDGVKPYASGFSVTADQASNFPDSEHKIIRPYLNGRDLAQENRNINIIDCFNLSESDLQINFPTVYQWLLERVYPDRAVERDGKIKGNWWLFERNRPDLRKAIKHLTRYIVTVKTSKHRVFSFLDHSILPDQQLVAIASDDGFHLAVLSSKIHVTWALVAGGTLEDRPRYNNSVCFDPFPFPDPTDPQKQKIRDLGDRLDTHRKRIQATHPEVTITAMYNLLEKIRKGDPLDDKDKAFNQKALVSTLKQIHDELDLAVFEAYGWASDLTDDQILENLVKLNAQRAEEERNGHIRWLRPDYQAPDQIQTTQGELEGITPIETPIPTPATQQKWPKDFKDQLAAIRDLLRTQGGEWTVEAIAAQFKNATRSKAKINDCLDALETLGLVAQHTENSKVTWYFAELQKAG
jgi:hypothetical protein